MADYKQCRECIKQDTCTFKILKSKEIDCQYFIDKDVVPRSELEYYKIKQVGISQWCKNEIELIKAKQEVAEQIFEEIEKIRLKQIRKCETLREQENEALQRKYWEGGYNSLRQLSYWIAELKKKYIGE